MSIKMDLLQDQNKTSGTCYQGEINISYNELCLHFSKPNAESDGYKTDVEWALKFWDDRDNVEEIVTIYNWKDGPNYCGDTGCPVHRITEWHIGAHNKSGYLYLVDYLKENGASFNE